VIGDVNAVVFEGALANHTIATQCGPQASSFHRPPSSGRVQSQQCGFVGDLVGEPSPHRAVICCFRVSALAARVCVARACPCRESGPNGNLFWERDVCAPKEQCSAQKPVLGLDGRVRVAHSSDRVLSLSRSRSLSLARMCVCV